MTTSTFGGYVLAASICGAAFCGAANAADYFYETLPQYKPYAVLVNPDNQYAYPVYVYEYPSKDGTQTCTAIMSFYSNGGMASSCRPNSPQPSSPQPPG